jgi:hypothetical protein
MNNPQDHHRIGQACLLRRQGKTYNEIRAVIGPADSKTLAKWMKGIPRPLETYRSAPRVELRRECRRLRGIGLTYYEIAAKTGASIGSINLWVRDIRHPVATPAGEQRHHERAMRAGETLRAAAEERRQARIQAAVDGLGAMTARDLFVVGVALYWAEGS